MALDSRVSRTAGYFAVFVTLGLQSVLGPTLPALAQHTQTELSEISFLFTAGALGYMLGSFQGGRLYDRVPGHLVMVACLIISASIYSVVPVAQQLWVLTLALFVLGMAGGALDVGGNTLLIWVHGSKVGPAMNGLHFFFGLGSFVAPIFVAQALLITDDVAWAYWALALLHLPVAAWLSRVPSPQADAIVDAGPGDGGPRPQNSSKKWDRLLVLLVAILLFLYVGAELSFGGWIFTYAVTLGLASPVAAGYLTSAFWGALTVGRLMGIPIALRLRPGQILVIDLVGCLISAGVLFLSSDSSTGTWLGTLAMGLFMASIFPTTMSLAERHIAITGQATGWFLVGASAGGMSIPFLAGQLLQGVGPQSLVIVIAAVVSVAFLILCVLLAHSSQSGSEAKTVPLRRDVV